MAFNPTTTTTLFFFLSYLTVSSPSSLPSSHSDSNNKVSLALYYESLCPYSANFIVNFLPRLIQKEDIYSIVDLYLSPWGNAKLKSNDTFTCQHGPVECFLNTVEACAIHIWPQVSEHFAFIECIETFVYEREYSSWDSCFGKLGLDSKPIEDCLSSGDGKKLELIYGAETNRLVPPHQYVPWVVVDGQPLYEDYENFISYICDAYKGPDTPKGCSSVSHGQRPGKRANKIIPVSHKVTETPTFVKRMKLAILKWMEQMYGAVSM